MTVSWSSLFKPVLDSRPGTEVRTQQEQVGDAIMLTMETGVPLLAEAATGTGKSLAILVPLIDAVKGHKPTKKYRGVISTETNVLLKQYERDLAWLSKIYPEFTYAVLMGRGNYLCLNAARNNVIGDRDLAAKLELIESRPESVRTGERAHIEKIVGLLDDREWEKLAGNTFACQEYDCQPEDCYSAKARAKALEANIVITNHALLQVDADQRARGGALGVGILGEFEFLFVDEAHTLESVLMSGWTDELTEWELNRTGDTLVKAVEASMQYASGSIMDRRVAEAVSGMSSFLVSATDFHLTFMKDGEEWQNVEEAIRLRWVKCLNDHERAILEAYEVDGLNQIKVAKQVYGEAQVHIENILKTRGDDMDGKTARTIRKGLTAAKSLHRVVSRLELAMTSKNGTVVEYGVPYAVVLSGRYRRDGAPTSDISVVPLDISSLATDIWRGRRVALLSATLRDMTDGTFRYVAASLGIGQHNEITVAAPFDYANVQKVYVTTGQRSVVPDIQGARYSFEEMVDLINAAKGRTLVLFTARAELEDAAHKLNQLAAEGKFNYPLLVQWAGSNKAKLAEDFEKDTNSVLLGLKSFFTGNSFEGETLSQVIICKYPLPRYNAVCKQQINWWRRRGFSDFYERESMNVFRQAAGRLIRSSKCKGVVSILDQRAVQEGQNVRSTLLKAVSTLGSDVTQDIDYVRTFLS